MKKLLLICFLIINFVFAPYFVFAEGAEVALNQVDEYDYFYPQTFDNLVLDFKIIPADDDILESLVIKNKGTALYLSEIEKIVLHADNGNNVFDNYAIDKEIAEASYDYTNLVWFFNDLDELIPAEGKNFYVTVKTKRNGTNNKSFQFSIPAYLDSNDNGQYDIGDTGVFLNSGVELPTEQLFNQKAVAYRSTTVDIYKPVTVMTNLEDGQVIKDESFTIVGQSRDQGGSYPEFLQVCINDDCQSVNNFASYFSSWEYEWNNIVEGEYLIYTKTRDFNNNTEQTEPISVQVEVEKHISVENSSVFLDKTSALADGIEAITVLVTLKDVNDDVLANKTVYLSEVANGLGLIGAEKITNQNGQVEFYVRSDEAGDFELLVTAEDGINIKQGIFIEFTPVDTDIVDYTTGRWVKLADSSAIYYLDEEEVRHAYPTQAVWQSYWADDFSFVETISGLEMASYNLGRNVPFKAGTLIKIPSVPKVYQVEQDAVIRWITTEEVAENLHGQNWASLVQDLPVSFFTDYTVGADID